MQRQQQLLDRSFRARSKQGEAGQPTATASPRPDSSRATKAMPARWGTRGEMGDAAGQQEALRRMLGEMMRQLGEGARQHPRTVRAGRTLDAGCCRRARAQPPRRGDRSANRRARPTAASGARSCAADAKPARQTAGASPTARVGATDRAGRERIERDPLGRPISNNGTYDRGDVKIPDENILQKSRRILDELRRRAGERTRPEIELDYIDRLLKRF